MNISATYVGKTGRKVFKNSIDFKLELHFFLFVLIKWDFRGCKRNHETTQSTLLTTIIATSYQLHSMAERQVRFLLGKQGGCNV